MKIAAPLATDETENMDLDVDVEAGMSFHFFLLMHVIRS